MKMSKIQFNTPLLREVQFVINEGYDNVSSNINVIINHKNDYNKDNTINKANVYVEAIVGSKDNFSPFYIKVVYTALFTWQENANNVERLLRINGTALLYGYIRQTVLNIISNSKFKRLDLPFIDFNEETEKKNDNK